MNWFKRLFSKEGKSKLSVDNEDTNVVKQEIPWDYIRKTTSDNDAFFNEHKDSLSGLFSEYKGNGSDPVIVLVAYEQEKWCALLALLYSEIKNMYCYPEMFTKTKPIISNNGFCDVYAAPIISGNQMQAGVYVLDRDWLISRLCWVKGLPSEFIKLIKEDQRPGMFDIVVFAAKGMRVEHLPLH